VALGYQVVSYRRVAQSLAQMRGCLASGYPFVFGFTVYDGFESDEVAAPARCRSPGRASGRWAPRVVAVGYDDATQRFLVRNSWGSRWGRKGYCTMPYGYLAEPNLRGLLDHPADGVTAPTGRRGGASRSPGVDGDG